MKRLISLVLVALVLAAHAGAAAPNAPAAKPVVLFVHGAWGGGWQFRKVAPLLEARGYVVYRPTLTGLGERVHLANREIGLETHIEDIENVIRFENLHDVILVGHSYGGMVITGVADRMPDRMSRLVFLDAMVPRSGESATTTQAGKGESLVAKARDGFIPAWWVKPDKPYPRDVPHPVKTLTDVLTLQHPTGNGVRAVYILTVDRGHEAKDDDFFPAAERARGFGWPVIQMEGDHNPYWFQPEKTVEVLEQAFRL
ncbi:MAG: alpha/beta fold hydrolase [Verrucomicrobia bacterium]|nr:alpha/beta fold hydrolase [Verrucomicrobiota bacterium]